MKLVEKTVEVQSEPRKQGFTSWFRSKLLGKEAGISPVDTNFLTDLRDVTNIGRYVVIGKLGQGSMGIVYHGRDPYINRDVSIKVSRPAADIEQEKANRYRERFFIEAQAAGKLMHPNIVSIYDAGMHKDFCYITMEYINGPTMEKFCQPQELLPLSRIIEIIFTSCRALDYAHKQGIVHRDIKPSNIMLNEAGEVRITDFGIAQIKSEQKVSKGIIGSPCYMSPEQVREEPVNERSDIFSLGCVLYELLTGHKAFPGDNYFSVMYKITNEEPPPIREFRKDIPEILSKITNKALAKDPNERYQTCSDFAYDLRVALRGLKEKRVRARTEDVVDYVHHVPFFDSFTRQQVFEILQASNLLKVPKKKIIVAEGEIDDCFFIILSGRTAVVKNRQPLAFLNRGECFGEMSYLSGQSRAASVVSLTDCILLKISATLLDRAPESVQLLFLKKFALTMLARLSRKNEGNRKRAEVTEVR